MAEEKLAALIQESLAVAHANFTSACRMSMIASSRERNKIPYTRLASFPWLHR
jgi:hypothetical protein